MAEFWLPTESDGIKEKAEHLIARYHPHLADCELSFLFKDKPTTKEACSGLTVSAKKVPPAYKVLLEGAVFMITIDASGWSILSDEERIGHLDMALASCRVKSESVFNVNTNKSEEIPKLDANGRPIFYIQPFDITGHASVISRYGPDMFKFKPEIKVESDDTELEEEEENTNDGKVDSSGDDYDEFKDCEVDPENVKAGRRARASSQSLS